MLVETSTLFCVFANLQPISGNLESSYFVLYEINVDLCTEIHFTQLYKPMLKRYTMLIAAITQPL